ncbi:MAG TPA: ABC transporter ATP-binding protein [Myxococcota bacterium]|nr:ABC transporter ATP-binding protein [Myxococcota bacterium]
MTDSLTFERVSKRYQIPHRRDRWGKGTWVSEVAARARRLIRGAHDAAADADEVWALREVSFSVARGEVLGIVGHNGAGKSTLLKVLTRITEPSSGRVLIRGKVTSLLEVGTGFHPELTGRENVFLYGAILGMDKRRVAARFDTIVAFADVARFLDLPLKRWSSGMALRLAFAVASHLEHETLVVDEALSVGDAAFRAQCLARIEAIVREEGRTVLFVSHDLGHIRRLAKRSILLERGRLEADGPTSDVLSTYLTRLSHLGASTPPPAGSILMGARLLDPEGAPKSHLESGAPCTVTLELAPQSPEPLVIEVELETAWGLRLATTTLEHRTTAPRSTSTLEVRALTLGPGPYRLAIVLRRPNGQELERHPEALTFMVTPGLGSRTDGLISLELGPPPREPG